MRRTSVDTIEQFREKMRQAREHGAKVVVRRDSDGVIESVRWIRRLPDGTTQWTDDTGKPIPHPGDAA